MVAPVGGIYAEYLAPTDLWQKLTFPDISAIAKPVIAGVAFLLVTLVSYGE